MTEKIIIAGSGGQGALTLGVFFARIGVLEGKRVTWLPAYGAEKRGGFSFCYVVISDEEIFSPVVEDPDTLIVFDQRAFDIFGEKAGDNTLVIENSSLVKSGHCKGKRVMIPATDIANKMKFLRGMNIVIAGTYHKTKKIFKQESAMKMMRDMLGRKNEEMIEYNIKAFEEGIEFAENMK